MTNRNEWALRLIETTLQQWELDDLLQPEERDRCLQDSRTRLTSEPPLPLPDPPASLRGETQIRRWRGLQLLAAELRRWTSADLLRPESVYRCQQMLKRHFEALREGGPSDARQRLQTSAEPTTPKVRPAAGSEVEELQLSDEIVMGDVQVADPPPPPLPRRSILEILLDPQTIRVLLIAGACLLTLGLAGWLWAIGLFDDPLVGAVILGAINLAVLAVGVAIVQNSRYQTAGKAITLLACLVMPLNLWFYDAQGLISLDEDGHLWIPALAMSIIYAVVARVLKDEAFVYALVGGVTLTGLLFLGDARVARFWEITAPAVLLIVVGAICVHCEMLFPPGEGPFSRNRFGRAFFRAGHLVLGGGLALLLSGQLTGAYYESLFAPDWRPFERPQITELTHLKWVACGLTLLAAYVYGFSRWVLGRGFQHVVLAAATAVWGLAIVLDIFHIRLTAALFIILLSALACVAFTAVIQGWVNAFRKDVVPPEQTQKLALRIAAMGQLFAAVAVGWSLGLLAKAFPPLNDYPLTWWYVFAAASSAVASGMAAWSLFNRESKTLVAAWTYSFTGMRLVAVFAALHLLHLKDWHIVLPILIAAPLLITFLSVKVAEGFWRKVLQDCCMVEGALLLLFSIWPAAEISAGAWSWKPVGLLLFYLQACVLFAAGGERNRQGNAALMAASGFGALWQVLLVAGVTSYTPWVALSLSGIAILVVQRLTAAGAGQASQEVPAKKVTWSFAGSPVGHLCITVSLAASILMAVNQWAAPQDPEFSLLSLLAFQFLTAGVAATLSGHSSWRRTHLVLMAITVIAAAMLLYRLLELKFLDVVELCAVFVGVLLFTAGVLARLRDERADGEDGIGELNLGSLAIAVPPVTALLAHRFLGYGDGLPWVLVHEVGVLALGLVLLGLGVAMRVRLTTLAGAASLGLYVFSLVALIRFPEQMKTASVYMMVGGGAFFLIAIFLSVFRDRLLTLPGRMQRGEGVFQVMKWK